jgi:hypothetical protein
MALEIDAFHVLSRIASQSALASLRAEAARQSGKFTDTLRKLLARQIKAHGGDLVALRSMRTALGGETFDLVVEGMKDSEIKTLVGKLDRHHPDQKAANAFWRRGHFRALVAGAIEPAPAPPKRQKGASAKSRAGAKKPGKGKGGRSRRRSSPEESDFLEDPSAGATRDPEGT